MVFINILMKLRTNKAIVDIIVKHKAIFKCFDSVYLFGSVLDISRVPNDIDLLLIYSMYSKKVEKELKTISFILEQVCGLPVDLTVLSVREEFDTQFLKKVSFRCLKIK